MPDLNAGSKLRGLDTPPTVSDVQAGQFTFTNTTYGVTTTGGTYADCGVSFTAPTSGRVAIDFAADGTASSGGAAAAVSPVVRTGGTVGSGTSVAAATDDEAVYTVGTARARHGARRFVEGLVPGDTYNVRLEHHVTSASTGTVLRRSVTVSPAT